MPSKSSIFLQGGTLLLHDENNHVVPIISDLLVEGSVISKLGPNLQPPEGAKVIDCKDKLISPGFIDTHRHLWQSQLGGMFTDMSLWEYMPRGNAVSVFYTPEDLFYGELSAALESFDAGTTTVVDHSSCNSSLDHRECAFGARVYHACAD
jgi:cytosine/adenosine deaminase-related metal-dependent hydrolase